MPGEANIGADIAPENWVRGVDAGIAAIAERQHGVVARGQLAQSGLGAGAIKHRLATGRLHVIHRGVYAVGHRVLSREGQWLAAVLAGGDAAVLSHRSAAELWGLLRPTDRAAEVTADAWRPRSGSIRWHLSSLRGDERAEIRGIPVTSVARTLLDLAAVVDRSVLEKALNEAEVRELGDRVGLLSLIDRHPGRRGIRVLRALLGAGELGKRRTRSELERRFLRFVRRQQLPVPEMNAWISVKGTFVEADCVWRSERLIVELDGRAFHDTSHSFESDRLRDRHLVADGWRVVRVTWRQLVSDETQLARDLRDLLGRNQSWG